MDFHSQKEGKHPWEIEIELANIPTNVYGCLGLDKRHLRACSERALKRSFPLREMQWSDIKVGSVAEHRTELITCLLQSIQAALG